MGDQARNQGMDSQAGSFIGEGGAEQSGSLRQFLYFLMHHKKWWLTLVIIVLLLLALLIVLGGSAAAPFHLRAVLKSQVSAGLLSETWAAGAPVDAGSDACGPNPLHVGLSFPATDQLYFGST